MIIVAPGVKSRGKVCPRTVELLDLYPTLADLAGLTPPANLAGASLKPLLDDPTAPWDRPAFTQLQRSGFPGYSVRTERWRYTEWDRGRRGTQLYDLVADPREEKNVAADPQYADVVEEMRAHVKRNWPRDVEGGQAPAKKQPAK
jgi:uncharacterized sulfatase